MIEYVTKNEETDELELKPISYGIPEHVDRDVLRFPDWSKTEAGILTTSWTAPSDGWVNAWISTENETGEKQILINGIKVVSTIVSGRVWNDIAWAGAVRKGDTITCINQASNQIVLSFTPYD